MNIRKILSPSIQIAILLVTGSGFTQEYANNLPDSIDIFILQEANHLWDTYGGNIWESYNSDELPVLLFQSPEQQWLVNHPNPPAGFSATNFLGNSILIKNSNTNRLSNR